MVCVDANVVLEVIQKRKHALSCEIFLNNSKNKAITTLTLDLAMYFSEKDKLDWEPIKTFLESFVWLPLTGKDGQWAFANYDGKDFEDALQIGCAIREQCSAFATLDQGLAKKYKTSLPIKLIA